MTCSCSRQKILRAQTVEIEGASGWEQVGCESVLLLYHVPLHANQTRTVYELKQEWPPLR